MSEKKAKERENRITIRVSDAEMTTLKDAAEKDDRTITSFVRMYSIKYAKENFGYARELAERERLANKELEVSRKEDDLLRREAYGPNI